MQKIQSQNFDEERALYNLKNACVERCIFAGTADGESALKEAKNIAVRDCQFSLRYPLWHVKKFELAGTHFDGNARAPLWYSARGNVENCEFSCVKAFRECQKIALKNCQIFSEEFGWKCKNLTISDSEIDAVYCLFESQNVRLENVKMRGKYSFQYTKNLEISRSILDTKDAFWHSKNVVVRDTILRGEYLGWFSENLTLVNCHIAGTQPLCYCKNLRLVNCTTENCDLAFEYSSVDATIRGNIVSVKNPLSGTIRADSIGEIVRDGCAKKCSATILCGNAKLSENYR